MHQALGDVRANGWSLFSTRGYKNKNKHTSKYIVAQVVTNTRKIRGGRARWIERARGRASWGVACWTR